MDANHPQTRLARYDVIHREGTYLINVHLGPGQELPFDSANNPIIHRLPLWFWGRLPWLGKIVRNMWAKSRGGRIVALPPIER